MIDVFRALWQYRHLTFSMAMVNVRARYRRTALGLFWSMLGPVALVLVIGSIYGQLVGRSFASYVPFLFAGLFPWTFITQVANTGCVAFINAEGYVKQIAVPMVVYPARAVLASFIHFLLSFTALVLILMAAQFVLPIDTSDGIQPPAAVQLEAEQAAGDAAATPSAGEDGVSVRGALAEGMTYTGIFHPLGLITVLPGLLLLMVFGLGLGLFQAVVGTIFRDYQHISTIVVQTLFYATPIIYPPDLMDRLGRPWIYQYNPFHYLISAVREPLLTGMPPALPTLLIATAVAGVALLLGVLALARTDRSLVMHL